MLLRTQDLASNEFLANYGGGWDCPEIKEEARLATIAEDSLSFPWMVSSGAEVSEPSLEASQIPVVADTTAYEGWGDAASFGTTLPSQDGLDAEWATDATPLTWGPLCSSTDSQDANVGSVGDSVKFEVPEDNVVVASEVPESPEPDLGWGTSLLPTEGLTAAPSKESFWERFPVERFVTDFGFSRIYQSSEQAEQATVVGLVGEEAGVYGFKLRGYMKVRYVHKNVFVQALAAY